MTGTLDDMSNHHVTHRPPDPVFLASSLGVVVHDRMTVEDQCLLVLAYIDECMGTRKLSSIISFLETADDEDRLQVLIDDTDAAIGEFNDWLPPGFYAIQEDGEFWLQWEDPGPQVIHGPADERYCA